MKDIKRKLMIAGMTALSAGLLFQMTEGQARRNRTMRR